MIFLVLGLILFFVPHFFAAFRSREEGRDIRVKMGEGPYMGAYSLVAIAGFGLIIYGYMAATPTAFVYAPPAWGRHAAHGLMLIAFVLLAAAYTPSGHIKKLVGHPMITAVAFWALAHLLTNGGLKSVLVFGAFLAFTVIDRIVVSSRSTSEEVSPSVQGDLLAIGIGVGAFLLTFFVLHEMIFGVPVL